MRDKIRPESKRVSRLTDRLVHAFWLAHGITLAAKYYRLRKMYSRHRARTRDPCEGKTHPIGFWLQKKWLNPTFCNSQTKYSPFLKINYTWCHWSTMSCDCGSFRTYIQIKFILSVSAREWPLQELFNQPPEIYKRRHYKVEGPGVIWARKTNVDTGKQ